MDSAPSLSPETIQVIRAAMRAAGAGRVPEAISIGDAGLARGGDPVALHAMLGTLHLRTGLFEPALGHLQSAHALRPDDPIVLANLGATLAQLGRFAELLALVPEERVLGNQSLQLTKLRAYAEQMTGEFGAAARHYARAIAHAPDDWEAWNNLGNCHVAAGDVDDGIAALARAAELNPAALETRLNLSDALKEKGVLDASERCLRSIIADFPTVAAPLVALADLLDGRQQRVEARAMLARAAALSSDDPSIWLLLGWRDLEDLDMDRAEASFRAVLRLDPQERDAYLGLADVLEHHRPGELPVLLAAAQQAGVDEAVLNLIQALIAKREGKPEFGLSMLDRLPDDFEPVRRFQVEAQLRDRAGETDGAFAAAERMNEELSRGAGDALGAAADLRSNLERQIQQLTPEWRDSWRTGPVTSVLPPPIFLAGFPRSGTTLLDTMLMGHPELVVAEEKPILARLRGEGIAFHVLPGLSEAEIRSAQERYFAIAREYVDLPSNALLVDKSPLHMNHLPQIYRLFPNARVILALRHPADAVLSCFMTAFRLNASMANFLKLESAAEFYDLSFGLLARARGLFPVNLHSVVYEELVANPQEVLGALVDWLGIAWAPALLDHRQTALKRGIITTASYAQVTEPLYRRAVGRWHKYRHHLEPVLPVLEPWIAEFGYAR